MLLRLLIICELLRKIFDVAMKYLLIAVLLTPVWIWAYLLFVLLF